jgi:hypothetical protein
MNEFGTVVKDSVTSSPQFVDPINKPLFHTR